MTFRKYINILFSILTLFLLSSCSDFLKGKPKQDKIIEIKQESMSCLNNVSLDIKKFLKAELSNSEIEKTFLCFDNTLKEFQTRVEGTVEKDSFTTDDLHQIFEKFIKDGNISKEAARDLLMLKSALLGGSSQKITKEELSVLREYLISLRAEVINIAPYVQLFSFKKSEIVFSKKMIKEGFAQLNLSLKNLLKISKLSHSNYQFSDLKNLAVNLNIVSEDQKDIIVLAEKVNELLAGRQQLSSEEDRFLYIDNLTEVLRLYSTQVQGYVKFAINNPSAMNDTFEYVHDMVELLENTAQYKKSNIISYESIDPLLTEILKKDILPVKISNETALSFYKMLLVRVFESGLGGDVSAFTGIKKVHFVNFKRELAIYRIYNNFIEEVIGEQVLTAQNTRLPLKDVQAKLKSFDFKKTQEILNEFDKDMQEQILVAVEELRTEFIEKNPVLYRFNKIVLAANQEIWDQNWEDLARGLYYSMISRELLLGWGQTPLVKELKNTHIVEQGLVQWYSEFKKFGIETKSFDPRSKNSGASNLISANLFTRAGNGDKVLTFREAVQFLGILFSGGGKVYNEIAAGLKKANCNLPELDAFENNWNNEACAFEDLKHNYKYYFSNLSYLVRYLDTISKTEEQFKSFYDSLMDVARVDSASKGRLETADLRNMSTILHYVESIFAAYDVNRNGYLSENEIKMTYPKFKSFAEQFARKSAAEQLAKFNKYREGWLGINDCFTEQDLIRESFVFMIYFGKTPTSSDLTTAACTRNKPLIEFKGEADRKSIINAFKIIKKELGS